MQVGGNQREAATRCNIGQRERETGACGCGTEAREAVLEQKDVVAATAFGRLPKMRLKSEQPGLLVRYVLRVQR